VYLGSVKVTQRSWGSGWVSPFHRVGSFRSVYVGQSDPALVGGLGWVSPYHCVGSLRSVYMSVKVTQRFEKRWRDVRCDAPSAAACASFCIISQKASLPRSYRGPSRVGNTQELPRRTTKASPGSGRRQAPNGHKSLRAVQQRGRPPRTAIRSTGAHTQTQTCGEHRLVGLGRSPVRFESRCRSNCRPRTAS
jgi:hypothetical protein